MMRRNEPPRPGSKQFLGVVRAIAGEVASEQRMTTDELMGESYERCLIAHAEYNPDLCSTFAHFAFKTVKRSMIRDISRDRRRNKGEKVDGGDRPTRKHTREVVGGEIVVRNGFGGGDGGLGAFTPPDWWALLTPRQRSIVLFLKNGEPMGKIVKYLGLPGSTGPETVAQDLAMVKHILTTLGLKPEATESDDKQDAAEPTPTKPEPEASQKADMSGECGRPTALGAKTWSSTAAA